MKQDTTTSNMLLHKLNRQNLSKLRKNVAAETRVQDQRDNIPLPSLPPLPPALTLSFPDNKVDLQTRSTTSPLKESIHHIFDEMGNKLSIDKLITGKDKHVWNQSLSNKLGRLSDGFKNIKGTNTIDFIKKSAIPKHKKITYANMVCDHRPLKTEKHRVRLTIGGDRLDCTYETASPAASLLETKLLLDSVISDANRGARFLTLDIKDFFLQSYLKDPEYMRIHSRYFTQEFRDVYKLHNKINTDGYVYCVIQRGMYGLKQAAILAYQQLVKNLKPFGYHPVDGTTCLWRHQSRPTKFALCVDDFGVKYFSKEDAFHLINALKTNYKVSQDWTGKDYCGLKISWNYDKLFVDISMPKYVSNTLLKYQHKHPAKPQYTPHKYNQPIYGKNVQYASQESTNPILPPKQIQQVQSKVGTCLYYGRGVDPTILVALNELGTQQAKPTATTEKALSMLFDYLSTYPNAIIRFVAGTMQLKVESDASYLAIKGAKSRIAGHF